MVGTLTGRVGHSIFVITKVAKRRQCKQHPIIMKGKGAS